MRVVDTGQDIPGSPGISFFEVHVEACEGICRQIACDMPAKPIAVLYATREGHTRRIAERVAAGLRKRGLEAEIADLRGLQNAFDPSAYCALVLAASVHVGQHEREMVQFAKKHRARLPSVPNAFLSVTLSQASVQRETATAEEHARFVSHVQNTIDRFVGDTGWHPEHVVPVAGALRYSRYNFFVRLVMKCIARQVGGSTDTSRDHDYTDWAALDRFVERFADEVRGTLTPMSASGR
jgi:menaquinone-dependent protoporphyrinogen oxidase